MVCLLQYMFMNQNQTNMKDFVKDYFVAVAEELEISVSDYYKHSKYNYVIIEDGDWLFTWDGDNTPVIYGGMVDVEQELEGEDMSKFTIMTEKDFIDTYCKDEITIALANEIAD